MSDFTTTIGQMAAILDGCFGRPDFDSLIEFAAQEAPEHPGSLLVKNRNNSIILNAPATRVVLRFRFTSELLQSSTQSGVLEVLSSSRKTGGVVPMPSWATKLAEHIIASADARLEEQRKKEQAKNKAARLNARRSKNQE